MAKLGDIATYINGYAFKPQDWSDEGIPIIRIQDLTGNSYQANRYNGEYASKYEVNDGDVLISWSASLGIYIWHGEKAVLNQHIFKVVFDKERISKDFFVHQVGLILENAASDAHGATMKHLTKPVFDALPFYLPPYEKQCEIAEVLDKVCELISLRKQQLAKLDELVKARFVEMFGDPVYNEMHWETKRLIDICRTIVDCPHSTPHYTTKDTGYKCIRTFAVKKNKILWEKVECISKQEYEERIKRKRPEKGDVIYTREGAILGIAAVIDRDYNVALGQRSMLLSPDIYQCTPCFLSMAMNFDSFLGKALGGVSGSASPHINVGDIKALEIIAPPIEIQNQFSTFVEQVDQQKQTVQQSLEKLELMKKALMQEYFG